MVYKLILYDKNVPSCENVSVYIASFELFIQRKPSQTIWLIKLPEDHVIAMFVAIGKGIQEPWSRGGQLPMAEVAFTDHF